MTIIFNDVIIIVSDCWDKNAKDELLMTLIECLNNIEQNCYNPKLKKEFIISQCADNEGVAWDYYLTFKGLSRFEKFFSRDLLWFTRNQLLSVFETITSTSSSFEETCRRLKNYYSFHERAFPNISYDCLDMSESLRANSIRDNGEFRTLLQTEFQDDSKNTLDIIRKTCLILLYLGVNKNDIVKIKKDEVDCDNGTVFVSSNNKTIDILYILPDDCVDTIRLCKSMTNYNSIFGEKKLIDSDLLIRRDSSSSADSSPTLFVEKIFANHFKSCDKRLNPTRVVESGYYYWMYKKETELGRDFEINEFKEYTTIFFGKSLKKYMHYFQNYVSWKRAYYK